MRTSASAISSTCRSTRRCADNGMRRASAWRTDDARPSANDSSASPPESISTTSAPARYSCSSTAATIEIPANRSEPNWRRTSLSARDSTSGTPPAMSTMKRGNDCVANVASEPQRKTACARIPAIASAAIADERAASPDHHRGAEAAGEAGRPKDCATTFMTDIEFTPRSPSVRARQAL
jgi:hypothetical protein